MKNAPCNLCGSDNSRELFAATLRDPESFSVDTAFLCTSPDYGQHHRIVKCNLCGFVYANPRNDEGAVLKAYEAVEDPIYLNERDGRELTFRQHLKSLQRYTGAPQGRRLLDVGAYIGVFVQVAGEAGWQAEGIEPSSWAVGYARQNGLNVRQGTLAASDYADETFDVITLWDVIEHFADPRAELAHVYRLLKPGGVVVIHTIDMDSITAKLMGKHWPFLMEMHITYFSRATLHAMLAKLGFRYLGDHTQGRYLRLGYLAGRFTAAFGQRLGNPIEQLVKRLNLSSMAVPVNTLDLFTAYARKPK